MFINDKHSRIHLAAAIALAFAPVMLSGCAGGSATKPVVTPPTQPADPCVANPSDPSCAPDNPGDDNPPTDPGEDTPPPTDPGEDTPPPAPPEDFGRNNHLIPTGVNAAHEKGLTGEGVKIGMVDSGVLTAIDELVGKVAWYHNYAGEDQSPNDEQNAHGTIMAQIMVGSVTDAYFGGVAPGATLWVSDACGPNDSCLTPIETYSDLFDQGVRLFNTSLAITEPAGAIESDPGSIAWMNDVGDQFTPLVEGGGLFVWGAGNDGPDMWTLSGMAARDYPALREGWLVAVNVGVDYNGELTGLAPSSASCGDMAEWCLAAPGYARFAPIPNTEGATGAAEGTSISAALITGVSALVWEAFPWMTNDNVRQTVLTTATHLGDGPDDVPNATYGWGLVNADKAVDGPAQFAFGAFEANVGDSYGAFKNPISGTGSLVLDGTDWVGSLQLAADNTYSGGTTIEGASLWLTGSVASDVVLHGGELFGNGTVKANVTNQGGRVTSYAQETGTGLTINGSYTAGADSVTEIWMGNPLNVGGNATLDGGLMLSATTTYSPEDTELLIHADGRVSGQFSKVVDAALPFYRASVVYDTHEVTAKITRSEATAASSMATPLLASVAHDFENVLTQADAWSQSDYAGHQVFLDTAAKILSARSVAQVDASLASLSGEVHGTLGAIEATTSNLVDHAVTLHQNGGNANSSGASVWAQGFTNNHGLSAAGFASARTKGNGSLIGADIPVFDHFSAGIFAGRNRSNSTLAALGGTVKERDSFGGLYGQFRFDGGAYLAGRASWTHADLDVRRSVLAGEELLALGTQRKDGIGRLTLEAGKTFGSFTPYVSATALRINRAGFTEAGGNGFGLTAGASRESVTQADLGLRWAKGFSWAGGETTFTGYGAWKHVLNGESLDFTAALSGAPDTPFTVTGQSLVKNGWEAGAALQTQINAHWNWFVDVNAQGAANRYHAFGANAGVRFSF